MNKNDENKPVRCSFCGKPQDEAKKFIAGPGVYICDECIEVCTEIMEDEFENFNEDTQEINLMKPKEMKAFLDDYVIGQDEETCTVYGMPKAIAESGLVDEVLPLKQIADAITRHVGVR